MDKNQQFLQDLKKVYNQKIFKIVMICATPVSIPGLELVTSAPVSKL